MTQAHPGDERRQLRRAWWAIALSTGIHVISFSSLLFGALASQSDEGEAAGPWFALGFALVPLVFAAAAFVSGHSRAPSATLRAMVLWLIVGLPMGLINPITGLTAGYAVGGATALRTSREGWSKTRAWAVLLVVLYSTLLVLLVPPAGVFAGAVTPLLAIRAADSYDERRLEP